MADDSLRSTTPQCLYHLILSKCHSQANEKKKVKVSFQDSRQRQDDSCPKITEEKAEAKLQHLVRGD